jgi:RNA polymerase primary sigma factor
MRQLKITKQVTNREAVSVEKYLHEISKLELITMEQEVELARRIRKGDELALNQMVNANLRFVISVAKQYQHQGLSLSDLINEGNLGLIKAAQRFDETRGFKFISYAVWWIRQSILQALAEQSRIVRLPLNKIGSLNQINKVFALLDQRFEREPSIEEIALEMELSVETVRDTMKNSGRHLSMDAPINNEDDVTFGDFVATETLNPENLLFNESLSKEIERMLSVLTEREAIILNYFFGLNGNQPLSLDEIAEELGLTRERVRQVKEKALKRLKHSSRNELLKNYLG